MQILHWLFGTPHGVGEKDGAVMTRCRSKRQNGAKPRDLVVYSAAGAAASTGASIEDAEEYLGNDEGGTFTVVLSGDYLGACFYGTLQLKHLRSVLHRSSSSPWPREVGGDGVDVRRMGHKAEPESSSCSGAAAVNVGCKVLPICDAAPSTSSTAGCSSSSSSNSSDVSDKDSAHRGERRKAVSRVKELLRWAATAKSPGRVASKGWKVMYFRSKVGLKGGGDELDDSISSAVASSTKISFTWDAGGRCSTMSSSACSPLAASAEKGKNNISRLSSTSQCAAELGKINALGSPKSEDYVRNGQWITTDADFVVLEL